MIRLTITPINVYYTRFNGDSNSKKKRKKKQKDNNKSLKSPDEMMARVIFRMCVGNEMLAYDEKKLADLETDWSRWYVRAARVS